MWFLVVIQVINTCNLILPDLIANGLFEAPSNMEGVFELSFDPNWKIFLFVDPVASADPLRTIFTSFPNFS